MINPMKQHGAFSWNELMTNDIEGAKTFYAKMFNWNLESIDKEMPYTLAKIDGQDVAGLMTIPPNAPPVPTWNAYVTVDDLEASAKLAIDLGGKVLMEASDIPNVGRFCVICDPQGATLTLITYYE